jgi:transcriptional regulator with XRE-family HTH domain
MSKAQEFFGARLAWLFQNVRKPDSGKKYSSDEVGAAVGVSPGHIRKLRAGQASNPTLSLIEGLADFFGVDTSFFLDHSETDPEALYLTKKVGRDLWLERLALRASNLEQVDRAVVDEMLKAIIKIRQEKEQELNAGDTEDQSQ